MRERIEWANFAVMAERRRREGSLAEAEQLLRDGLDDRPDCAEAALVLALVLLDRDRSEEARGVLERWASAILGTAAADSSDTGEIFAENLSENEFESAFEAAETNPAEMFDANAIAQRAMRETEPEFSDELVSPSSSFATRTVAELLEKQGDDRGASRIRAIVDSPGGTEADVAKSRDRRDQTIEELERWLVKLRGGAE